MTREGDVAECDDVMGECDDVAIVGAGVAGAFLAYRLRDRNFTVTLYELSNRIGGRLYTGRCSVTWTGRKKRRQKRKVSSMICSEALHFTRQHRDCLQYQIPKFE